MSSAPYPLARNSLLNTHWIVSRREDLIYFIASPLAAYLLLALNRLAGVSLIYLTLIWAIIFDGPHIWGTISRTYLDAEERARRGRLLYGAVFLFAVGPLLVMATRWTQWSFLAKSFFLFASVWAYFHLIKQYHRFVVFYKKKNNDLAPYDNALDYLFLVYALWYPFVAMIINYGPARDWLPFGLSQHWQERIDQVLFGGMLIVIFLWLGRQIKNVGERRPMNLPKYLLMAGCISLHWIVIEVVMRARLTPLALAPLLTLPHNIQYHRLVWFYNSNKYHQPQASTRSSIAALANKTFLLYAVFGLAFGFLYEVPRSFLEMEGGAAGPHAMALALFWGVAFTHYYLDAKIWRVRRDPVVSQLLHLG